jgi:spermidine synthase
VTVVELVPEVVAWNREHFGPLAGNPLDDPRVKIRMGDVAAVIGEPQDSPAGPWNAILLDVDNGPDAFTATRNASLYDDAGIAAARHALKPGGTLAVWSAWEDRRFEQRLKYGGFAVTVERVRARLKAGGPRHTIFLGTLESTPNRRSRVR